MENVHGVDISWLHKLSRADSGKNQRQSQPASAVDTPSTPINGERPMDDAQTQFPDSPPPTPNKDTPPQISAAMPSDPTTSKNPSSTRRPLLGRPLSEKTTLLTVPAVEQHKSGSRRNSWLSNLSAKFSSSSSGASHGQMGTSPPAAKLAAGGDRSPLSANPPSNAKLQLNNIGKGRSDNMESNGPQSPKQSGGTSFFSNALKRLSSGGQSNNNSSNAQKEAICPRKVLNRDPNRERVLIPELNSSKLRRVAFMVDVQVAGGSNIIEEVDPVSSVQQTKGKKLKEKGEGEALKNPQAIVEQKDQNGFVNADVYDKSDSLTAQSNDNAAEKISTEADKEEKKGRKRWKAEESGRVPVQHPLQGMPNSSSNSSFQTMSNKPMSKLQNRPTTDPVRIYRRCCQLRETPILKRITEQLSSPDVCPVATPGVVTLLDLTGSRLQLPDFATLGDWLAIVPVKKLLLEDAHITDEGLRVVLAGLLAAKLPEKIRKHGSIEYGHADKERTVILPSSVVERISLRNNPRITKNGWNYISLFVHMCRSLKAIDVSLIPFPPSPTSLKFPFISDDEREAKAKEKPVEIDTVDIFSKALAERRAGSHLEELIMSECNLTTYQIRKIVDGVEMCETRRLGLAGNNVSREGIERLIPYLHSGVCTGLDLGNNNLRDHIRTLADALNKKCTLWALSLAECNLDHSSLELLLPALTRLTELRFIDLSHNRELLHVDPAAVNGLRQYMPQLKWLKRIHLNDVSMSAAQAIRLVDVLPECPQLAHLNLLQNPQLAALASAGDEVSQEEAAALYASLMAAVRVSDSIIAIDIDVPAANSSEIVKALAKQVLAYCLRNMERVTVAVAMDSSERRSSISESMESSGGKEVKVPDVLAHLVGHVNGEIEDNVDNDDDYELAPDEDYIVGGTGVVKALSYCLSGSTGDVCESTDHESGTATPKVTANGAVVGKSKAMNMSKHLLESARSIRARLQPALIKEAKKGDEMAYKRLSFLDATLSGIIRRFEEEFPECRLKPATTLSQSKAKPKSDSASHVSSSATGETSISNETEATTPLEQSSFFLESDVGDDSEPEPEQGQGTELESELAMENGNLTHRKRHMSDVSLASRALAYEEGNLHKLSQHVQRGIMRPSNMTKDHTSKNNISNNDNEPNGNSENNNGSGNDDFDLAYDSYNDYYTPGHPEIEAIRQKLESLTGEEIRNRVRAQGYEETMRQIGKNAEALRQLETEQEVERSKNRTEDERSASASTGARAGAGFSGKSGLSFPSSEEEYARRRREAQLAAHVDILKLDEDGDAGARKGVVGDDDDDADNSDNSKEEGVDKRDVTVENPILVTSVTSTGSTDTLTPAPPSSSAVASAASANSSVMQRQH